MSASAVSHAADTVAAHCTAQLRKGLNALYVLPARGRLCPSLDRKLFQKRRVPKSRVVHVPASR